MDKCMGPNKGTGIYEGSSKKYVDFFSLECNKTYTTENLFLPSIRTEIMINM